MQVCLVILAGLTASLASSLDNLNFSRGNTDGWEGSGFSLGPARGSGPSTSLAVCSSDRGQPGHTARLQRTLLVPPKVTVLHFRAAAFRPQGVEPMYGKNLDVILDVNGEILPREVWTEGSYRDTPALLPSTARSYLREYRWDVSAMAGRRVRVSIIDQDDRPGCFVACGGFRFVSEATSAIASFAHDMGRLPIEKGTAQNSRFMGRLDTRHFVAMGPASDADLEYRLSNCEALYSLFFSHFRKHGFTIQEPSSKMMVAVFDTQSGFEAYLGRRMPTAVTGLYHPESNRLLIYDYESNRGYKASLTRNRELLKMARSDLERDRLNSTINRIERDHRDDTNISTVMHEAAHQLSFNCGLLNRHGDVPLWLAEGLACYCEPSVNGAWQGIGETNPIRASRLARVKEAYLPLRDLIVNDNWLRTAKNTDQVLLGYSQSWALFGMLMRDRPRALRHYLVLIGERRTPEHRLADFGAAFGSDLATFEKQYRAYLREAARQAQ
jgi:Protein of unknown function (DUF1570)